MEDFRGFSIHRQPAPQMPIPNLPVSHSIGQQNSANVAGQAVSNNQPPTIDPEKVKMLHRHLIGLLHAQQCPSNEMRQCNPLCRKMKQVLSHMTSCSAGKLCPVTHCSSSVFLISHFKNCKQNDCFACAPVKQAARRKQQQIREHAAQCLNRIPTRQTAQNPQSRVQTSPLLQKNSTDAIVNQSTQNSLPADSVQPKVKMENVASPIVLPILLNATTTSLPTPFVERHWHKTVNRNFRQHFVQRMVEEMAPTKDISTLQGTKRIKLFASAEKAVNRMYSDAGSMEEYFELQAEKVFRIAMKRKRLKMQKMKLREKKRKKLALQQQQVGGPNLTPMLGNNAAAAAPTPNGDNEDMMVGNTDSESEGDESNTSQSEDENDDDNEDMVVDNSDRSNTSQSSDNVVVSTHNSRIEDNPRMYLDQVD